jgi:uncharacterized protein (DUF3820 family)
MKNALANAQVIGFFSMPSPTLAEHNPTAYYMAMADMPSGAGSCSHCGTGIMHHVIIRDETGKTRFIGTQCAEKVGIDPEALRLRKSREQINAEKAAREEYLTTFDASVFDGGKYSGRKIADVLVEDEQYVRWFTTRYPSNEELKRQIATCEELLAPIYAAEKAAKDSANAKTILAFGREWLEMYANSSEGFCQSVASSILKGEWVSERADYIMREVWAKHIGGRKGSKKYQAAWDELEARFAA